MTLTEAYEALMKLSRTGGVIHCRHGCEVDEGWPESECPMVRWRQPLAPEWWEQFAPVCAAE